MQVEAFSAEASPNLMQVFSGEAASNKWLKDTALLITSPLAIVSLGLHFHCGEYRERVGTLDTYLSLEMIPIILFTFHLANTFMETP